MGADNSRSEVAMMSTKSQTSAVQVWRHRLFGAHRFPTDGALQLGGYTRYVWLVFVFLYVCILPYNSGDTLPAGLCIGLSLQYSSKALVR